MTKIEKGQKIRTITLPLTRTTRTYTYIGQGQRLRQESNNE
jgi:YD repeat-containing protein